MTTTHDHEPPRQSFEDSEGLRALLSRLHTEGRRAWRNDPEAAALMEHAAERYSALARKHGLDPWEAAAAAFDAMRNPSVRKAEDPWAMVTKAVQLTCIFEERANGLLCSVHQARRPRYFLFHDVERFSDRDNPLVDYHPALHSPDPTEFNDTDEASRRVGSAVEDTIMLFALLGWPSAAARTAVEYVCARLGEAVSRTSAFESLRRDWHARALLDLPGASWLALLRVVLGNPDPDLARTSAGRGVLLRLLVGEPLRVLLADDELLAEVVLSAPPDPSGRDRE